MRILQVVNAFPPAWGTGGPARVVYELSKELVKRGHIVTVYTTDIFDSKSRLRYAKNPMCIDGVKVYHFKNLSNKLASKNIPIALGMMSALKRDVKNYDVIHAHLFRCFQSTLVYHYAKKHKIPYVLQPDAATPRVIPHIKLKALYDVVFGYKILKQANKVIAISKQEALCDHKMGVEEERISTIYCGMELGTFKSLPRRGKFKEKYGINGKMILYLGRINRSKGIDYAIKAFAKLAKERSDVIFVVAGPDDGYRSVLEKLKEQLNVADKVKFVGFIDEADKISAYVDADLFVHSVIYMGGVGLAPLEAILCGTPVIVSNGCGEVVKDANCGYIVAYDDIDSLKVKMNSILENPEEACEMVRRGKKYIRENLTWERVTDKVESVYEDCIHRI